MCNPTTQVKEKPEKTEKIFLFFLVLFLHYQKARLCQCGICPNKRSCFLPPVQPFARGYTLFLASVSSPQIQAYSISDLGSAQFTDWHPTDPCAQQFKLASPGDECPWPSLNVPSIQPRAVSPQFVSVLFLKRVVFGPCGQQGMSAMRLVKFTSTCAKQKSALSLHQRGDARLLGTRQPDMKPSVFMPRSVLTGSGYP